MQREIGATTSTATAFADVRDALLSDPARVLADRCTSDGQLLFDLDIDLASGACFRQAVAVRLGRPQNSPTRLVLPLEWTASGRERLFPRFAGELVLAAHDEATRVVLVGRYVVPLGAIGRFGDGVAGRRLARRSLVALLERIAVRLTTETKRQATSPTRSSPFAIEVVEQQPSELYVG